MSGKLYWRIKKNGKWTWTPATVIHVIDHNEDENFEWIDNYTIVKPLSPKEE